MKFDEDLAEIVGIMLGDGCLYKEKRSNKYQTVICFHKEEKEYLEHVKNLFENYFRYKFYITKTATEILLRNMSVFVGDKLLSAGLFHWNKINNKVIIPQWIFKKNLLKRTIRGLFDTDGCVYRKYDKYAQIVFKFGCEETTNSLREALVILHFNPTITKRGYNKEQDTYFHKFYLSQQEEISRFFKEIEPKNPKHFRRYQQIKNGAAGI